MSIEAFLQGGPRPGSRRSSPRRKLRLELAATTGSGAPADGVLQDVSETGFLLQSSADLALGDRLELDLPHAGGARATVVWLGEGLYGCQFATPISKAAVSAAQLRGQPERGPEAPAPAGGVESFGARLRRLRKQRQISLIGLARLVEVSKPTMWKWERDDVRPRQKSIEALAEALGVSERELLLGGRETGEPAAATAGPSAGAAAGAADEERTSLSDTIRACKEQLAELAGTTPDNVTITIRA